MGTEPAPRRPARTVTRRVLGVLDAFCGRHRRLSLTEISDRTGMPMATAHRLVGVLSRVGGRWPAHATGVGLVLLAHAPIDEQERYLAGPLASFTSCGAF